MPCCPSHCLNRPALKATGEPRFLTASSGLIVRATGSQRLEKIFLFRQNGGGTPNRRPNIPPELLFQPRNDFVPHSIAPRIQFLVGRIFAKLQPVLFDVLIDLGTPDPEQRAHDFERTIV